MQVFIGFSRYAHEQISHSSLRQNRLDRSRTLKLDSHPLWSMRNSYLWRLESQDKLERPNATLSAHNYRFVFQTKLRLVTVEKKEEWRVVTDNSQNII